MMNKYIEVKNSLGYTVGKSFLSGAKILATLNKLVRFDGNVTTRLSCIVTRVVLEGFVPKMEKNYTHYSAKIEGYTKPKTRYTLENDSEKCTTFCEITKTEFDFANWLIDSGLTTIEAIRQAEKNEEERIIAIQEAEKKLVEEKEAEKKVIKDEEEIATTNDDSNDSNYNATMVEYAKSLDIKHYQRLRREVLWSSDIFTYATNNKLSNDDIELMLYMEQELNKDDGLVSFPYVFDTNEHIVNEGNNAVYDGVKSKVKKVCDMVCHNGVIVPIGNEYDLEVGKMYLRYEDFVIEVYHLDIGKEKICIKVYDGNNNTISGNSSMFKSIKRILKMNNLDWTRSSMTQSIEIDIDDIKL